MNIRRREMPSFCVIGKLGSTDDGEGFIQKLWTDANEHFSEVAHLAKKDDHGIYAGFWGAMSDMNGKFEPWEDNFTKGLYLAGVEVNDDAYAPKGWVKWQIPSFEYLYCETEPDIFENVLKYIAGNGYSLAGAVHDFTCPETGKNFMFFPIKKL